MHGGSAYTSAAMIPGIRPTLNSAITGTRYTKAGIVCIASRIGFKICWNRSLLAAAMPSGIARITESVTATETCASVSIAMSHIPSTPIAAKHRNDMAASRQRRDTCQASSAAPPAHHPPRGLGEHLRRAGSSM